MQCSDDFRACSYEYCLNEDFPCRWLEGCRTLDNGVVTSAPIGLSLDMIICQRGCDDHDDLLDSLSIAKNCDDAAEKLTCTSPSPKIAEFCPVRCRSKECSVRCSRDEAPIYDGRRCYELIQDYGYNCLTAMQAGADCHCTCGNQYAVKFSAGSFDKREDVVYHLKAEYGEMIPIQITGTNLGISAESRIKVVHEGANCHLEDMIPARGIECKRPVANSIMPQSCTTRPEARTPFYQRWRAAFLQCGRFQICHCNSQCDEKNNWKEVGFIDVAPPKNVEQMYLTTDPGLQTCLEGVTWAMQTSTRYVYPGYGATPESSNVVTEFAFHGGFYPEDEVLGTLQLSIQAYFKVSTSKYSSSITDDGFRRLQPSLDSRVLTDAGATTTTAAPTPTPTPQPTLDPKDWKWLNTSLLIHVRTFAEAETWKEPTGLECLNFGVGRYLTVDPSLFYTTKESITKHPYNRTYTAGGKQAWGIEVKAEIPIILTGVTTGGVPIDVHQNKFEVMEYNLKQLHTRQENKDRIIEELRKSCDDFGVAIYVTNVLPGFPADPTPRPTPPPTEFTWAPTPAPYEDVGCADDPGQFPAEMRKESLGFKTCKQVITFLQWEDACGERAHLRPTMEKVCRESCGLCPTSTAEPIVVIVPKGDGVVSPLPLPGNIIKMSTNIECVSKEQRERMIAGIRELDRDPRKYIRGLITKLQKDKINDVPAQIWISVVSGPEVIFPVEEVPEEEGFSWFTFAAVFIAVILAGGLAVAFIRKRREAKKGKKRGTKYKDAPASPEATTKEAWKSESPKKSGKTYRKNKPLEDLEPEPKSPAAGDGGGGWMGKLWRSKGASPEPAAVQSFDAADPKDLVPGTEVRLFGLSKIEYNGLKGVVRGPAEKEGRFVIDVVLYDSASVMETQELSLKADNLRVIPAATSP
jgi:hypothetical protein